MCVQITATSGPKCRGQVRFDLEARAVFPSSFLFLPPPPGGGGLLLVLVLTVGLLVRRRWPRWTNTTLKQHLGWDRPLGLGLAGESSGRVTYGTNMNHDRYIPMYLST